MSEAMSFSDINHGLTRSVSIILIGMRKHPFFICASLFTIILLAGCAPPIFFADAQPFFAKEEVKFKKKYRGEFIEILDSSRLMIYEEHILVDELGSQGTIDTLFLISKENVLKAYKKKYYLNYRDPDGHWVVNMLDLKRDRLSLYCPNLPVEDKNALKEIGKVIELRDECDEVVKVIIEPTKKGFKELIQEENLIRLAEYRKISNPDR